MPAFIPIGGGPIGSSRAPSNPYMVGSGAPSPLGTGRLTLADNGRRPLLPRTVAIENRLLRWLYNRFDKSPYRQLALQLDYDGRMTWAVTEDRRLVSEVQAGSGGPLNIDLTAFNTIAALANYLAVQPGYSVPYLAPVEISQLSPQALMRGSANIATTNGRNLDAFTSELWAMLESLAAELDAAARQIPRLPLEMATTTADGDFLDTLGSYYGVPRLQDEPDGSYGPRIIAEVLRPKCNNVAIELAIEVFTGQSCTVTDVQIVTATAPLYDGTYTYDGSQNHDGLDASVKYNLFDVVYAYDLVNGTSDVTGFADVVRGIVNRIRAGGTHLRSLSLSGSVLTDSALPASDDFILRAIAAFNEAPDDPVDGIAAMVVSYRPTYSGVRTHDGSALYNYGVDEAQYLDGSPYP